MIAKFKQKLISQLKEAKKKKLYRKVLDALLLIHACVFRPLQGIGF
jgi:hypothetical protein